MNLLNARRLIEELPDNARVVDVGGGAAPFPRADSVIDALAYCHRDGGSDQNAHSKISYPPRYTAEAWIQIDICDRRPWPVADKSFDFAVCSHLLEDIRDPIWVCSELQRIAKAGYIEVPSRIIEQTKGVEHPRHAGYYHHRWLIDADENTLVFRHKPHLLHSVNNAVVANLRPAQQIQSEHSILVFQWENSFEAVEIFEPNEEKIIDELCCFASKARSIQGLIARRELSWKHKLKRYNWYLRQLSGMR
jgi:hypothetical protein